DMTHSPRALLPPIIMDGDLIDAFLLESSASCAASSSVARQPHLGHGTQSGPALFFSLLLRLGVRDFLWREPHALAALPFCTVAFHAAYRMPHQPCGSRVGN